MKVLVLTESLDPSSGWGAYARGLVNALRGQGVELTVLTADASNKGPRLPGVAAGRLAWLFAFVRLWRWLTARSFDAVHVMVEPYARLHRAFGDVPFVITVHGTYGDPAAHGLASASFRAALKHACRIVAVSEYTKGRLAQDAQAKTVVIPNGVDLEIVHEPFDPAPAHGVPLVLAVGAMKARKGFDRLIAGFAEFVRTHPNAELVVIGRDDDPTVQQRLLSQVASLGIAPRVRFLGQVGRRALLGWYRACDVFALTPVLDGGFEGFGLVYLEANVFGKPCVGSRDSGARDAIKEGENGYLANAEDPKDVARALERAMHLPTEGMRRMAAVSSWSERDAAYNCVYSDCLKRDR